MSKETEQKTAKTAAAARADAPVYTAAELSKASKRIFDVSPDIATAAFHVAGVTSATVKEAEKIVKEFANKEVK